MPTASRVLAHPPPLPPSWLPIAPFEVDFERMTHKTQKSTQHSCNDNIPLKSCLFRVFIKDVFRKAWLNRWSLVLDSIRWLVSLPACQHSSWTAQRPAKNNLISINSGKIKRGSWRITGLSTHSGNYQGFRSSVPGTGNKGQMYIFHYTHSQSCFTCLTLDQASSAWSVK
jgi:hypothetical protein